MKYPALILLCFLTSSLVAQINIEDTLYVENIGLVKELEMDTADWKPVLSYPEQQCVVYGRQQPAKYSILFHGKDTCYLEMPEMGYLYEDSTRRINVNGKGSKELLMYFQYEYAGGSEFGGYQTQGSGILVYDLDNKKLLLKFELSAYDYETSAYFLDSLGNEVFLSEDQKNSILDGTADEYVASVSYNYTSTESHFNCKYNLSNKRFILDCLSSEPQDANNNSEEADAAPMKAIHAEYKLKNGYWVLQKK